MPAARQDEAPLVRPIPGRILEAEDGQPSGSRTQADESRQVGSSGSPTEPCGRMVANMAIHIPARAGGDTLWLNMHSWIVLMIGVILALLGAGTPPVVYAATFTVDSQTDAVDASPGDGKCATA